MGGTVREQGPDDATSVDPASQRPAPGAFGILNNVQVLRGLAAMMVVLFHAGGQAFETRVATVKHFGFGAAGVDIFFVISGFIMVVTTHSFWGMRDQWWRRFLKRRLTRIVPMYWGFTTLKLLIVLALPALALHSPTDLPYVIKSYLFVPARNSISGDMEPLLPVGWTLNFEMLFYVVFALGLALSRRPLRVIGPVLILLVVVGFWQDPSWGAAASLLNPILLEFLVGAWIGLALLKGWYLPLWVAVGTGGLVLAALPWLSEILVALGANASDLWRVALFGLPGVLLVLAAVSLEHAGWSAGPRSLAVLIGNASYAIYLSHGFITPAVARACVALGLGQAMTFALIVGLSFVLSAAVGILTYRYIEQPVLLLLRGRPSRAMKQAAGEFA